MQPKFHLSAKIKMNHRLFMSRHMKYAIYALTLPVLELKDWVEQEIEKNPLLEKSDLPPSSDNLSLSEYLSDPKARSFHRKRTGSFKDEKINPSIVDRLEHSRSLFDKLLFQAAIHFTTKEDIKIAEYLIGNLNSKGFLDQSVEGLAEELRLDSKKVETILKVIQKFDPPGIAARTLQESLQQQLEIQNKENSMAYKIVKFHFNDLVNNNFKALAQKLSLPLESLQQIINKELKNLAITPTQNIQDEPLQNIVPDITIRYEQNRWVISINDQHIPRMRIQSKYNDILHNLKKNERDCFNKFLFQAKWVMQAIESRKSTLIKVLSYIIKKQNSFFRGTGPLVPMNYKELASNVKLHLSTIYRAISNKYADTPIGLISLKALFSTYSKSTSNPITSTAHALKLLKKLIAEEDKQNPLSDEKLAKKIDLQGISLARRTVAKYRKKLKIASAKQRKRF